MRWLRTKKSAYTRKTMSRKFVLQGHKTNTTMTYKFAVTQYNLYVFICIVLYFQYILYFTYYFENLTIEFPFHKNFFRIYMYLQKIRTHIREVTYKMHCLKTASK